MEKQIPQKEKVKFLLEKVICFPVSDAQGALTWLLPSASLDVDAAVDELCQRIFLDEQADETLLLGPVLLASFAYAIMISPW